MSDHRQPDEREEGEVRDGVGPDPELVGPDQPAPIGTAEEAPMPILRFDERGRLIAPTEAELKVRNERIAQMIERIGQIPDDPDEDDADFFRAMDSLRPDNPLFEGLY